jgi:glycosyltransferase involved in cell wall biosynthesis
MYASFDKYRIVNVLSDSPIEVDGQSVSFVNGDRRLMGKKLTANGKAEVFVSKPTSEIKVAVICNWQTKCGISTYSKYLVDSLKTKVKDLRIFSEVATATTAEDGPEVDRCWKRGECLLPMIKKVLEWEPDFVIIQHEYGIFPNAFYFMQMMQQLDGTPYVVTLHSVYEHLDKIVYSACIKNIVVHTQPGKDILVNAGNTNQIDVIPHGCVEFPDAHELWNICQNPYTIIQFGFGFAYKGVERALDALHHLKNTNQKFENIFYIYLLSENEHTSKIHHQYYKDLMEKINNLGLQPNVAIIRKYQPDKMINLYLRLAKLAIFPYLNNPNNNVYAASGAIRIALANKIPVIASESHLFDELHGTVPRPADHMGLAAEIDRIFSNGDYRANLISMGQNYIQRNSWDTAADQYLALYKSQGQAIESAS